MSDSSHPMVQLTHRVPFNRPSGKSRAATYVLESLASPNHCGDGPFTHRAHDLLRTALGVPKVLLTTSCTHALEMAGFLLDLQPGDEVIVPSFTFVSTANAFAVRGAKIVFCDIRPDTLNLDETKLEGLITSRTRCVVPVHYAGVGCEMDAILEIATRHGVSVVEDNAHGLFGQYRGKWLGTFGLFAAQSFHETKNFSCGEGGALLINDPAYVERAEIIREKGTNRSRFFRGQVDKYSWVGLGSSYLPSDLLAAVLLSQLEARDEIQAKRHHIWETYQAGLRDWAETARARLPIIPPHCEQAYHMFYVLLPSLAARDGLIAHLKERNVCAVFHYLPLHLSEYGRRWGGKPGDCPITEDVSDRLIRLPFFNELTDGELERVVLAVSQFRT